MARALSLALTAAFIWRFNKLTPLMYMFCDTFCGHTSQAFCQKG